MAFVSYTFKRYDPATKRYTYTLTDSDFGAVEVGVGIATGAGAKEWDAVAVVKEYSKRGLPVGKNLALLILYLHKETRYSISDIKRWQDTYCPKHIENWDMYAKERDEHLTKLLALL